MTVFAETPAQRFNWQTPTVIMVCGCLIGMMSFGPRSGLGFFLTPMSSANGWGRDVFALALAIQMLLWGAAQPVAGAIADRFGPAPVLSVGAVLYAIGLAAMAYADTPAKLHLSAGVVIGFGLAGASFTIVIGAFGKLMPATWRSLAFGAGTAAGSFGQFLFSPLSVALMDTFGWQQTLTILAATVLLIMPLSLALAMPRSLNTRVVGAAHQSLAQALTEALGHRSYVLLVLGFFTCGPRFSSSPCICRPIWSTAACQPRPAGGRLALSASSISWERSAPGGSPIICPSATCCRSFGRAMAILLYIMLPPSTVVTLVFGAVLGLFWLSTVPPTSGLIVVMFGTRWLATLFGLAFFSHQVGGFLGVWLGGLLFERTGSYDVVWWLAILFGVLSAVINLPIVEKPIVRPAFAPA